MVLPYAETMKSLVGQVDVDMEVCILHVESHEPCLGAGKEGIIEASVTIWNLDFWIKVYSRQRLRMGWFPLSFLEMRKYRGLEASVHLGRPWHCLREKLRPLVGEGIDG